MKYKVVGYRVEYKDKFGASCVKPFDTEEEAVNFAINLQLSGIYDMGIFQIRKGVL